MLDEYMIAIGYNMEEISLIKNSYPLSKYSEGTLLYNLKNLCNYFRRNGIKNEEIINITITIPNIICTSIENIKTKLLELSEIGFNKINSFKLIRNYPYILELSTQKIENKINLLNELGFSLKAIIEMFEEETNILGNDKTFLKKRFNSFLKFGFRKDQIIKILSTYPKLFSCEWDLIYEKINELKKLSFTDKDIVKIITTLPEVIFSNENIIKDKFKYLLGYGFSELDIVNIIKKVPYVLYSYYLENLNFKIETLSKLGLYKCDIILIICNNPYIIMYSNDLLKNNFNNIKYLGFSENEVCQMIKTSPILLSYRVDSLVEKINYYIDIGFKNIIANDSKILKFNLELIKARFNYLVKTEDINSDNYKKLFLNDEKFYKEFGIKKNDLLKERL